MILGFLDDNIVMIVPWNYILLACVAGSFVCRTRKWAAKADRDSQFFLNGSLEEYLNAILSDKTSQSRLKILFKDNKNFKNLLQDISILKRQTLPTVSTTNQTNGFPTSGKMGLNRSSPLFVQVKIVRSLKREGNKERKEKERKKSNYQIIC